MPFLHFEAMDLARTYCFTIFAWILLKVSDIVSL